MARLPRISLNVYMTKDEHHKIKHFVNVMSYPSLRDFSREAIFDKMKADLAKLPADKRKAVEKLIADETLA